MTVEMYLDIDQVHQMTGVPQATLRNWEKRYGFPLPARTEGGHRLYTMDDIRLIREVMSSCREGGKVKEVIEQIVKNAVKPSPGNTTSPLSAEVDQILQSLYSYDEVAAGEALARLGMRLNEVALLQLIYARCLQQVGYDWESGRINIAQEHFSWNFFRSRLVSFSKIPIAGTDQPKVLLATPSGQLHEGGLLILSAYLALKGWRVFYLGIDVPFQDLRQAATTVKADGICLSAIEGQSILKDWADYQKLECALFIGGPCVADVKKRIKKFPSSIHVMEGDLPGAVENIEFIIRSGLKNKGR